MADSFNFADGSSAQDTKQLLSILEEKDTGLTQPHVARNDYANWVRHALHNSTLADRLEKCRSVQQVIDVLRLEHTPKPQSEHQSTTPQHQPAQDQSTNSTEPAEPAQSSPAQQDASEHSPEPVQQSVSSEPAPQREPIRDLRKASEDSHSAPAREPTPPHRQPAHKKHESEPREEPAKPDPVPKQSLLDRYNAREFLMGFLAGIVLTVLIYGIIGTLG